MMGGGFSIFGLLPIVIVVVLLLLVLAGIVIWRAMSSADQPSDFSSKYDDGGAEKSDRVSQPGEQVVNKVLKPATISNSADTVSNQTDDDIVDKPKNRFASQPTVDAMGDLSVSSDDPDEETDESN